MDRKRVFFPVSTWNRKPRVAICGYNDVGMALEDCMADHLVDKFICDEEFSVTVDDVLDFNPDVVFICHDPKIHEESRRIDATRIEDDFLKIMRRSKAAIVICSVVTPDIIERICNTIEDPEDVIRFVHWPCALRSGINITKDFKNMAYSVIGGRSDQVNELRFFFNTKTDAILPNMYTLNVVEAAYAVCAIHTFAATKLTFFAELANSMKEDINGKVDVMSVIKTVCCAPTVGRMDVREAYTKENCGMTEDLEILVEGYTNYTANSEMLQTTLQTNRKIRENNAEEDDHNVEDMILADEMGDS